MKTFTFFHAAQLLIALSIVSQSAAAQSGRGWMNGVVVDDSTSAGLPGAIVELLDDQSSDTSPAVRFSTKTDQEGKYSFKSIPMGDYTFRVRSEGYETYEKKVDIVSDGLTEIDVKLKKSI
jgi:hypothetical protein